MLVHLEKRAQIQDKVQVGALIFNKTFTTIQPKYSNYNNDFSAENVTELSKHTKMNNHTIKLEEDKQSPFGPIYSLEPVELETLKIYIKTKLANGFIRPSISLARALILFDRKLDRSLCFCMDKRGLNNITIKN